MAIQTSNEMRREYSNIEIAWLIDEWIHNERDRAILKRRLIDGVTYPALAEEFGLSIRRTKDIVYKAEGKLFSKLP